ncbi:MAG: hypothetical protein NEHIOOID_00257 [Holosporales bacterium]
MKNKYIIIVTFLCGFNNASCSTVNLTSPKYDLSAALSKSLDINCFTSLTLTDTSYFENLWAMQNNDPRNVKKPDGTPNPVNKILDRIVGYQQTNSDFKLTTNCLISDCEKVLGSLNRNITIWEIGCQNTYKDDDGGSGQTATSLPSTIKKIIISLGASLGVSPFRPLTIDAHQTLEVNGTLVVQRNGMLTILNNNLFPALRGNIYIFGKLYTTLTSLAKLTMELFYSESAIETENVLDDTVNGVGKISRDVFWTILGGTSSAPQYATQLKSANVKIEGFLKADETHKVDNPTGSIAILKKGTLQDVDNNLNVYQVTVEDQGLLLISKSGTSNGAFSYSPSYKIVVQQGGTIKFDDISISIASNIPEDQITILPGAIVDFKGSWSALNTRYAQMNTDFEHFPITLQTFGAFDLSRSDNASLLKFNHWNIGSGEQVFMTTDVDYMQSMKRKKIKVLPNVDLRNNIVLYPGQSLTRDNTAKLSGAVTVATGAVLNVGSENLENVNADKLRVFPSGSLIIESSIDPQTDLVKGTTLLYWPKFKDVTFSQLSSLYTFILFPDTQDYVGSIKNNWIIGATNQTAYFNKGDIRSITLLALVKFFSVDLDDATLYPTLSRSTVDKNAYSFGIYSNQIFKMDKDASFYMMGGSKTLIQKGAKILSSDTNVFVMDQATLETDGQRFSSTFIRSAWFQEGSIFNTLDVFYDGGNILYHVLWNIFSVKTPQSDLDYQQIDTATPNVMRIVIKPGAYVGVKKDTSVLLYNQLTIESGGTLEVLEGGEFSFAGGILNITNNKIIVNYGARLTLASMRYSLEDILKFVQFDHGAILGFGDAYDPATATKPAYRGIAYTLDDDKYGLGLIPEHVSVEFNNGVQTLLNVSKKMRLIRFQNQGILAVERDYPLSLYSGQTLDLNESDFDNAFSSTQENRYPYRMFIRSGSTLFLQSGARIVDTYNNMYTVLGVKAPIKIKTDAEIMGDIPGINRWIFAIKSTVSEPFLTVLDDVMLDLFKGQNLDMNEFTTSTNGQLNVGATATNGKLNVGAQLELTTTNTVFDNFEGVGSIPFFTWNIASKNNIYDQGQTISCLIDPTNSSTLGSSEFLKTINILDGAYVFSTYNYELKIGKCKIYGQAQTVDRQLKILKGGTLFISEDSLNASVNDLYVCAGASLIVDGKLTIGTLVVEGNANLSGAGKIKIGNGAEQYIANNNISRTQPATTSYSPIVISGLRDVTLTSDYEYQNNEERQNALSETASFDNPNFSNADYQIIEIRTGGNLTFRQNTYIVNNENALINILDGGILTIKKSAKIKNLGDISAFKGGRIISDETFFNNDNVLQSWFEAGSIFHTLADFEDGVGGIQSIPEDVEWEINADQTTDMTYFPSKKITVLNGKSLTLNNAFTLDKNQSLIIKEGIVLNGNFALNGILDFSNLQQISGSGIINFAKGAMVINPTNAAAEKCKIPEGGIIKNTDVWNSFPALNDLSSNAEWQIGTSAQQTISVFPDKVKTIKILSGASAKIDFTEIPNGKILILEKGSNCTFSQSLTVNGDLVIYKDSLFGTPIISVTTGGVLTVDGQMSGLQNVTIQGGKLVGLGIIEDSANSILKQIDNGEIFEIG